MAHGPVESPISELFRHNLWANLQLLDACQALSEEQLAASAAGTYGSVRETLLHIVGGEEDYLSVLTGQPPSDSVETDPPLSIGALRERAAEIGAALVAAASRVGIGDTYPRRFQGAMYQLPAPRFLVQILNHSGEHRTHIATILTQQGITPPDMSGWAYMHAMGIEPQSLA
jgi:uncharacterized damage-inducible protein DinB